MVLNVFYYWFYIVLVLLNTISIVICAWLFGELNTMSSISYLVSFGGMTYFWREKLNK